MAVNCSVVPLGAVGFAGVTPIDTSVAGVTARLAEPETPPSVALTVVEPWPVEVASPSVPEALLIVATAVFELLHVTDWVRFCVVPSV